MPLINVRVDTEDARKAAALRSAGVPISPLVRSAIRAEYHRRVGRSGARRRPSAVIAEILERFPDPPDLPPRGFSAADRGATRRHIVSRLTRR